MMGGEVPAIEMIVDVAGHDGDVKMVANLLEQADMRIRTLKGVAIANGHSLDDPVAGEASQLKDGTVNSYTHQVGKIEEQKRRLAEAYPEAYREIVQQVETRERERARERADEAKPGSGDEETASENGAAAPAAPRAARRRAARSAAKSTATGGRQSAAKQE